MKPQDGCIRHWTATVGSPTGRQIEGKTKWNQAVIIQVGTEGKTPGAPGCPLLLPSDPNRGLRQRLAKKEKNKSSRDAAGRRTLPRRSPTLKITGAPGLP